MSGLTREYYVASQSLSCQLRWFAHRAPLPVLSLLLVLCLSVWPSASAVPPVPVTFAVTFDSTSSSSWLRTSLTSGAPTGFVVGTPIQRVPRSGGAESIPSDVLAVPGVVGTDANAGLFPPYSTSPTAFSAYVVRPSVFGSTEALAPGARKFVMGADFRLNSGATAGGVADNGNNVVQRGLASGDQYKIQVDVSAGVPRVTCVVRDEGIVTSEPPPISIQPELWVRARCTRIVTGGGEHVLLSVTYPDGQVPDPPATIITFRPVANLDFATATASAPIPLSVGAKVHNSGSTVVASDSDQFNGQIDNVYLKIS
ncbi:MAG: hypothetical protein ACRCYU_06495 [Nocardioides sp.]